MMYREMQVSEICKAFELQYVGSDTIINGLNLCNRKSRHNCILTYATSDAYVETIRKNEAVTCVLISKEDLMAYTTLQDERNITFIECIEPEKSFYDIHDYLYYKTDFYKTDIFQAEIGEGSLIHASAVIEPGVRIGLGVKIGANTVIKQGTIIQDDCVIGCNTVIGSEGFQIIRQKGKNRRIVHCGGVVIGRYSCIGDNVTIANSLFEDTTCIGNNVMIDNLVYVGHNVIIEDDAVITAGSILCGSTIIKQGAWIGVNSSVLNRVMVGEGAKVGIGSVVTRNIPMESLAYGVPAKVQKFLT